MSYPGRWPHPAGAGCLGHVSVIFICVVSIDLWQGILVSIVMIPSFPYSVTLLLNIEPFKENLVTINYNDVENTENKIKHRSCHVLGAHGGPPPL